MRQMLRARTKGQTLVLVGLLVAFGVLLGFVALAADGGSALLQRRNMQNGADAASLAAAQSLAASVVLSSGVGIYTMSNADVAARVDQAVQGNRGGYVGTPIYTTTLEYGTLSGSSYTYAVAATSYGGSWHYQTGYLADSFVPSSVDAVRVTAEINNPTTFAKVIGIDGIGVSAVAAAALNDVENYEAKGPTWPMTRCQIEEMDPDYGVCKPFLFWSSNLNDPNCHTPGNFKNLLQLGMHQGASYEGAHNQLMTAYDTRAALGEVTGSTSNPCGAGFPWVGLWSPGGNCTDPTGYPPTYYGTTCCANNDNVADIDIANYIVNEFQGTISLTSTWPLSYFRSGYSPPSGDWIEVYNGGNLGQNISSYIRDILDARGGYDGLYAYYGKSIDKVMFMYDISEVWDSTQWRPAASNEPPNRVHMSQALRFRFYEAMANTGGFDTPVQICGTSVHYSTSSSKVYGVFSGSVVDEPPCPNPPCNVGHGLNNYVGYIDP